MKRKTKIILIAAGVLCLLLCSLFAFLAFTRGRTYVSEGITQNDRLRVENVYFEKGSIHYTLINETPHAVQVSGCVILEKKADDSWVNVETAGHNCAPLRLPAFSETKHSYSFRNSDALAGTYRLSFGAERYVQDQNGAVFAVFDPNETYLVGYLEITETQSPNRLPANAYEDNGVRKHAQVDFTASLVGGIEPKLLLTLTNNSEKPLILQLSALEIFRYHQATFSSCGYKLPDTEHVTVSPGETYTAELPLAKGIFDPPPVDPPPTGRYCVKIPYEFEEPDVMGPPILPTLFFADCKFNHSD
ncbi:MAG: hypothetical protein E7624_01420 [Ruminococcaceae bacterium]|nr:hypothetical protein [Oscillospiraceae bacterium]